MRYTTQSVLVINKKPSGFAIDTHYEQEPAGFSLAARYKREKKGL